MDSERLMGSVGILREAFNILFRNGKLMASITILTLLPYSLLFISNIFSTKSLLTHMLINQTLLLVTSPNSPEFTKLLIAIKEDARILFGVESIFILANLIILLFSITATIFASSVIYCRKNLAVKELVSRIAKSWIRLFVTWFYITVFGTGYIFLVLAILIPLLVIFYGSFITYVASIVLVILAMVLYIYLAVVWNLSIVISVMEERCYGIEAIGKAGRVVKGMELHGFVLNLLFILVSITIIQGFRLINGTKSVGIQIIVGLLVINFLCFVKIFGIMAYTVFYYQCKKTHGEEIELQGTIEYSKLSTASIISEDIP